MNNAFPLLIDIALTRTERTYQQEQYLNQIHYIMDRGQKYGGLVNLTLKSSCCVDPVQLRAYMQTKLITELNTLIASLASLLPGAQ